MHAIHDRKEFYLFYKIWYCVIISQITFCGIIVEIIWSYNQYNFFFLLQVYSGYSVYTCLNGIIHSKYEKYLPFLFMLIALLISRILLVVFIYYMEGKSAFQMLEAVGHKLANPEIDEWIGP